MNLHTAPKRSYFTATDEFCGAGGTTTGAKAAGLEVTMAMNHWKLAIETHNTNHPDVDHDCRDISASDPRRYPHTDFLLASPECTNHSLAKGRRRPNGTGDLFDLGPDDPANVRSRATMWDVPRFAEYHQYEIIIVENVVDARRWVMWDAWILAMRSLGYMHKSVYFNSMFAPPTPQSRDRMYVVFWRKGNPAPDLDIRPAGWCMRCMTEVQCVQSWKPGSAWGKYGGKNGQYIYRCPKCVEEVVPYYYAAFNAIDWNIPAQRIGDRDKPLKPRTIERIRYGMDRYGREPLVVTTRYTSGTACRARGAATEAMQTQPGGYTFALVNPGILARMYGEKAYGRSLDGPLGTVTTVDHHVFVSPPAFIAELHGTSRASGVDSPLMCVTAGGNNHALIDTRAFLAYYYGTMNASGIEEAMATVTTNDRAALVDAAKTARVEDCTFRMLQPHEIKRAMAFPSDYIILGNKRDQVKQLGNAVTPPVSQMLCERAIESLC